MQSLNKVIVDVPVLNRVALYHKIDDVIRSHGVGSVKKSGFVENRLNTLFKHFKVHVMPAENVDSNNISNERLTVPILDRKSQKKYLVIVGDLIKNEFNSQMNLI